MMLSSPAKTQACRQTLRSLGNFVDRSPFLAGSPACRAPTVSSPHCRVPRALIDTSEPAPLCLVALALPLPVRPNTPPQLRPNIRTPCSLQRCHSGAFPCASLGPALPLSHPTPLTRAPPLLIPRLHSRLNTSRHRGFSDVLLRQRWPTSEALLCREASSHTRPPRGF
jgi:hypothetical protein